MKHKTANRLMLLFFIALLLALQVRATDPEGARNAILQGAAEEAETVELKEYALSAESLEALFQQLRNRNELPWYAEGYRYSYNPFTGIVHSMTFLHLDEATYDRAAYDQAVAKILESAVLPGMSQYQIALSVHDYLASHFRYDESSSRFKGWNLLIDGTAVCEGYARAYMDVLKRAGLEAVYVKSDSMDHAWNLVKIDHQWYHVDVTWDDPLSDCYGRVMHSCFLADDATISDDEHGHYGWESSHSAGTRPETDTFWLQTTSPICYESASVCYLRIDEGSTFRICRRDEESGEMTELLNLDAGYIDVGQGPCHYQNFGLSLWNGRLYFSDMQKVYSMNTDGSNQIVVYTQNTGASGCFIRGSFVEDGVLFLSLSDHDGNIQSETLRLSPEGSAYSSSSQNRSFSVRCNTLQIAMHSLMVGL